MGLDALKKPARRYVENFAETPKAAGTDTICAALIFLNLLKGDADLIGQLRLAVTY